MQAKNHINVFKKPIVIKGWKYFVPLFFLLSISILATAQNGKKKIGECFLNNDFAGLISYLDTNVKLEILKEEEILTKREAAEKLGDFFSDKAVKEFKLIHEGGSNSKLKFFIASIDVSTWKYRTYFLYREDGEKVYISEVRIEAEE